MISAVPGWLVATAALLLTMPAAAQTKEAPPDAAPSLVGTWSGVGRGGGTEIPQADAFDADGTFVSVSRLPFSRGSAFADFLPAGLTLRVWGTYRATPAGPNQLRVAFQVQGWTPRELCNEDGRRATPECRPLDLPVKADTSLVTFLSPDRMQSESETRPGLTAAETRADRPALLQAAVPERWTYCLPWAPGACGSGRPDPTWRYRCDDLQQRRICAINGGHLVQQRTGCLTCVED